MARTISTTAGRTNRRFLLLAMFAAGISAILVYAAINQATDEQGGGGVSTVPAVIAKTDIPARTPVTADMVELRQVPVNARSELAHTDLTQVVGKVTRFPVATNEQVLSTKVVSLTGASAETADSLSFVVPKGMRAMAITVQEVINTGGLVLPGDYVDIIGVFDVHTRGGAGDGDEDAFFARTILQNVEVLAVAQKLVDAPPDAIASEGPPDQGQRERATEADPNPAAATVTLSVTQQQAQLLFLAEANGTLRLTVRPFGEDQVGDVPYSLETELLPPGLPTPPAFLP